MINMLLYQILAYTIPGKIQNSHSETKKIKISALTWNEECKFPDESYSA